MLESNADNNNAFSRKRQKFVRRIYSIPRENEWYWQKCCIKWFWNNIFHRVGLADLSRTWPELWVRLAVIHFFACWVKPDPCRTIMWITIKCFYKNTKVRNNILKSILFFLKKYLNITLLRKAKKKWIKDYLKIININECIRLFFRFSTHLRISLSINKICCKYTQNLKKKTILNKIAGCIKEWRITELIRIHAWKI